MGRGDGLKHSVIRGTKRKAAQAASKVGQINRLARQAIVPSEAQAVGPKPTSVTTTLVRTTSLSDH
jgi:hypothetical protein